MLRLASVIALVGCAGEPATREQRVIDALADDNYMWALREPALVEMKLRKMQRGPYEWLRGTAGLYWRDVMEPGSGRPVTAFGDPASSRVLLVGDPHPENVGTFRAGDGTMFVDWNDFDATGYGPYAVDLRRLCAGLVVIAGIGAPGDAAYARALAQRTAAAYAAQMIAIAGGARPGPLGRGANPLLDAELDTARTRGDRRYAVDEIAPVIDGARQLALGDLEDVAPDGLLVDRLIAVDAESAARIDRAIDAWAAQTGGAGGVKLRARRIGSGVSSYAAFRFNAVLEGATAGVADDRVIELKEIRDGIVMRALPRPEGADWDSPAARSVDTQRRLQVRPDGDPLLGHAWSGGISLKIRDREAYQRGLDYDDLAELAGGSAAARDRLVQLGDLFGGLLARAHGLTTTSDRVPGHTVIAPLLAGNEPGFADEIARFALDDATQIAADHAALQSRDLAAAIGAAR
jgi:uncharacterized protein (DUF2252 family)